MSEKRYWEVFGHYGGGLGTSSIVVSAETEDDAKKQVLAMKEFFKISSIVEIDALTFITTKVAAIEKKTEHTNDIFYLSICLIVFIIITNIIALFVSV
jgi:hypothetical protein